MTRSAIDLAALRQEYVSAGLAEESLHPDPAEQFARWMSEAVAAGLPLANAMTLATVGADGTPSARIVLLNGVEPEGYLFYTNYESRKGRELDARPEACLLFLWTALERQVRIDGRVERLSAAQSDAYHATRPLGARLSAWASRQSERVADRKVLEDALAAARARYGEHPPRPPHWGGYRVRPHAFEFWQGRADRLHDRLRYARREGGWTIERLAP